jgi:predicted ferric reductase
MSGVVLDRPGRRASLTARRALRRRVAAATVGAVLLGNAIVLVWMWWRGGNALGVHTLADAFTSVGRLTGLESAYAALVQVVLLARLPALERVVGFDRLTRWHRWNGHACIDLVVVHVIFTVWGYALLDRYGIGKELSTMLGGGIYPGMITATAGTVLLLAVAATSYAVARRKLPYEWWYAVHLLAYAGIALAWFHQIPTGNELVLDRVAADYWRALYAATIALLVVFRVLAPLAHGLRHRLRVVAVVPEGPGVVSVHMVGRALDRLGAEAGQFFLWRFLDRRRLWAAHPFSLSAAPDGRSLRITVKDLGDHSGRIAGLAPGTRVLAEGPLGTFTAASRRTDKVLLVAGGIGITPVRALLESMAGDVVVCYRVVSHADVIFRDELDRLAAARGATVHYLVGDHRGEGRDLLSPVHLLQLVPDLAERDVYLCGPPAMTAALERNLRAAGVRRGRLHLERFALT